MYVPCGTVYFAVKGGSNLWVCRRNPNGVSIQIEATKQWSSSFPCTWFCLLCYILCKIAVTFHWNGEVDPWSNWRKVQTSNTTKNDLLIRGMRWICTFLTKPSNIVCSDWQARWSCDYHESEFTARTPVMSNMTAFVPERFTLAYFYETPKNHWSLEREM